MKSLERPISEKIYARLCEVIPGGVNSPVRTFRGVKQAPMVIDYGSEDMIYDVDGHRYIDFCCSWGALARSCPSGDQCSSEATGGSRLLLGITSAIEEQIARKVISHYPSMDKVRFVSSGTEATMSAIRLARGYTGREILVKFAGNYHGHADHLLIQAGSGVLGLSSTSSSAGVPAEMVKYTVSLPYNDIKTVQAFLNDPQNRDRIAAVIIEPVAGNIGVVPATQHFVDMLRAETKKIGALLIFDEVITGFRVALRGAQSYYKIVPDITCLGKIVGGGYPAAAFGARTEIMNFLAPLGPVYQAGTLSGSPVAMEAGLQSIQLLEAPAIYQELERKTQVITKPVQDYIQKHNLPASMRQVASMFTLFLGKRSVENMADAMQLEGDLYARYFKFLFDRGIYIPPAQQEAMFVSTVHKEAHLEKMRDTTLEFLETL